MASDEMREIDRRIASELFNMIPCDQWSEINFGSAGGPALMKNCDHEKCYPTRDVGSIHGTVGGCPRYSTDIAASWLIVDHLKAKGYSVLVDDFPDCAGCSILKRDGDCWHAVAIEKADTVMLAICKAALATGGEEKDKR